MMAVVHHLIVLASVVVALLTNCANEGGGSSVCECYGNSVDMSISRCWRCYEKNSTENGNYMPSDWFVMDDNLDGDMIYTYTMMLETGVDYGYNFSNRWNNGYESGDGLADCAGGTLLQ